MIWSASRVHGIEQSCVKKPLIGEFNKPYTWHSAFVYLMYDYIETNKPYTRHRALKEEEIRRGLINKPYTRHRAGLDRGFNKYSINKPYTRHSASKDFLNFAYKQRVTIELVQQPFIFEY